MRLSITQSMVMDIDKITRNHAQTTASKGELKQLSTLFGKSYLRELQGLLQGSFTQNPGVQFEVTIRLAWIDKIPLAAIASKLAAIASKTERTELGDAVLFAFDELVLSDGTRADITNARAVLLQAKVAKEKSQIVAPKVPISAMAGSTKKEFDLLSMWPVFDLFKASKSATPLAQSIDLRGPKLGTLPYGWYIAAPRIESGAKSPAATHWTSWWMAGPPILNHTCDLTFGAFLQAFFSGAKVPSSGNIEVGASFQCKGYPPSPTNLTGWDRICAEIIAIVENSEAPQSIFDSTPTGRMAATGPISRSLPPPPNSLGYLVHSKQHPARIPRPKRCIWQLFRGWLDRVCGRKRIPVLIIHTRTIELVRLR
ncbi:hypothetical protein [Magnetospirillum sulfuroxidans]|uniref:Uncharacterized protein n=1 Tax=Magnetospirillum sulfuroxidans TaxID=611300 RepID=A0ABS5IG77_9PROT|nr:hypothetical protein [Magnetospirillum sulfuroxidans]MBR9973339.1 hypothetical protein [Magnetospirillum sulfuroxidans]